jgi:hypothetical protein
MCGEDGRMIDRLPILALLALASLPAVAAAPSTKRTYSITGFDRVRVDGPYQVSLKTNVTPYARASGSAAALDSVSIQVQGRTLIVRSSVDGWGGYPGEGRGPVTIEVGTHELASAYVNGAGALDIDKVRGLSFSIDINGSGTANVGRAEVDQLKVGITGAGTARLAGKAKKLTAIVRGSSSFDATGLSANDAVIGAEGPSMVRAEVVNSAKINASGLAAVTLTGEPACTVRAQGSANVVGCEQARR